MQTSRVLARLLTGLYALIVTPLATGLLSWGGSAWLMLVQQYGYVGVPLGDVPPGMMVQALGAPVVGIALLASVVATGIASSAGLLVVGVISLFSVVMALFPALLFHAYDLSRELLPLQVVDGLVHGLPAVLHPAIGGFGLALLLARRGPRAPIAFSVIGLVLVPAVLLIGGGLLFAGLARGQYEAMIYFQLDPEPVSMLLVLVGLALVVAALAGTRWSPYSLVAPALVLLAFALVMVLPIGWTMFADLWRLRETATLFSFTSMGGTAALGVLMLVFTGVLAIVRGRARRRLQAPPSTAADQPAAGS
ncbi:hypothetical protein [Brachybacterium hainanense]|uniref:Uncharacterized protein n=1 Tax=Brachybacterium hainanense TaxID=1541174 RepID=A0ABV6RBN4_9MICO